MKILQTFLFETDFFYEQIRHKLSFIYKKIVNPKNSLFWAKI
jgi:hypothetical protein